jgi:hypothetical protein
LGARAVARVLAGTVVVVVGIGVVLVVVVVVAVVVLVLARRDSFLMGIMLSVIDSGNAD